MNRRRLVFILSGVFLALLSPACKNLSRKLAGGPSGKCPVITAEKSVLTYAPPSQNLRVDVYLDATLSMKGFTEADSFSFYQQTIPLLESSIINTLKGEKAFYKFGNKSEELKGRDYLLAQKPAFYADANFNTRTLIENVLENASPQSLTVVVTDLFQDNADVNQLSDKIKSKFITANLAVGVLGIKSQFKGTVYDVGADNYSFPYQTAHEATFRPFYVLAFGSHANIDRYFDALVEDGVKNFPVKQRLILSGSLTDKPASYAGADVIDKKNINELSGTIIINDQNLNDFGEFRVRDGARPASIEVQLPFKPLPGTVDISARLEPETTSLLCAAAQATGSDAGEGARSFVPHGTAEALEIDAKIMKPDGINLKINISPDKLEQSDVNAFRLILRPEQSALPAWVGDWNMTDSDVSSWRKNPKQFDGTRTYNLQRFLQTVWATTENTHKPVVADLYLYIKP